MLTRDGKKYKTLFGPNPLLADQSSIPKKDLVFHNFGWNAETIKLRKPAPIKIPEPSPEPKLVPEPILESQELTEEDFFVSVETPVGNPIVETPTLEETTEKIDDSVILHCLPAFVKDRNGNAPKSVIYGDKFLFEGEIVDYSDLGIQIWTSDNRITRNSIVTPKSWKYPREESLEIFLTCKITRIDSKSDGFLLYGIVSDIQPDFS